MTSNATDFDVIDCFAGDFRWLSNFWLLRNNFRVVLPDDDMPLVYVSVEHAYQAAKFMDHEIRKQFTDAKLTAGQAKRLGRKFPDKLWVNWESVKIGVMTDLVSQKFKDPNLRDLLMMTGDVPIVEGNKWHDNFWGDCSCDACEGRLGRNILGNILMDIRKIG